MTIAREFETLLGCQCLASLKSQKIRCSMESHAPLGEVLTKCNGDLNAALREINCPGTRA